MSLLSACRRMAAIGLVWRTVTGAASYAGDVDVSELRRHLPEQREATLNLMKELMVQEVSRLELRLVNDGLRAWSPTSVVMVLDGHVVWRRSVHAGEIWPNDALLWDSATPPGRHVVQVELEVGRPGTTRIRDERLAFELEIEAGDRARVLVHAAMGPLGGAGALHLRPVIEQAPISLESALRKQRIALAKRLVGAEPAEATPEVAACRAARIQQAQALLEVADEALERRAQALRDGDVAAFEHQSARVRIAVAATERALVELDGCGLDAGVRERVSLDLVE